MNRATQIADLETASLSDLRSIWEQRYGVVPKLRSADMLRRLLAWRIQASARGGLDRETRRMLEGKTAGAEQLLADGTVISREWKGVSYKVEVCDGAYLYDGKPWKSLSEIAPCDYWNTLERTALLWTAR